MWTRRSLFLLVKVKTPGRVRYTLPLSLFVFQDLLDTLVDLGSIVRLVLPDKARYFVTEPLELISSIFDELRRHGRLQLVDIEADDVQVKVEFF